MIRDAEIENTILQYIHPLLLAAGLEPLSIRIHIVKDNTLNAFVAEGQQIFINTGLILKSQNANQLIGVLAHEIGHISGGHLIRSSTARKNVSATSLLSVLLGGAAIIAGRPDAGAAAIQFGNNAGIKNYLNIKLVMSHLTSSELKNSSHNLKQLNCFNKVISNFFFLKSKKYSLSNSNGAFLGKKYCFNIIIQI